ncbi:general secretion pathway protein GspK [Pseudobacteriovorax antillogorgiicola]|uniref:Type II secretory pathway, component PulK n=1 Tax=Pseudobacteriovorax antillogorgiicola TaxID=1513793 RepID=A0A1Y6BBU9_9BACT|nr:type II secretion system protein GspK [Pseudobacteriovorax antillogorgiicola]TCS58710.1 type II secretory pathway component PulK [Pseudobacteriovorax antillogorgiicola]SME95537.1 Type II secretory pathway, component PulK [Pseudobacteriovorax antillogorgiicola]
MKKPSHKKVKFVLGFPVETEDGSTGKPLTNRGVALLIAMFVTAMAMLFLAEMKLSSSVSNQLSLGHHLNVKGEYIAKSGVNLAKMLLTADLAIDLSLREVQGKNFTPADGPEDMWAMLNGLPIGGETLEMVSSMQESFDLSAINDSDVLDQLKLFDGAFVLEVHDETSKINVNTCGIGRGDKCMDLLRKLMSCPAEREYLERKKVNPQEIISLIRDWVDDNDRPDENAFYSSEDDPYAERGGDQFPKNARFDSLEELKLIPGWDDEMHKIFSPFLTVYPIPTDTIKDKWRINFNTADRAFLGCLLPKANQECAETSARYVNKRDEFGSVSGAQALKSTLNQQFCTSSTDDVKRFGYRSDVYRIKVTGQVEDQARTLEVVMQRGVPDEFDEKKGFRGAYKFLYWKML